MLCLSPLSFWQGSCASLQASDPLYQNGPWDAEVEKWHGKGKPWKGLKHDIIGRSCEGLKIGKTGRLWPWWTRILSPEWLMWCPARVWWRTHCHSVALICSQSGELGDHWSLGELGDHSEEPPAVEMAQAPSLTLSTVSIVKDIASTKDILGLQ